MVIYINIQTFVLYVLYEVLICKELFGQNFIIIYKLYIPRGSQELVYSSTGKRKYTIV